jgi:molybdenum cofactor cytidylyltransferase
MRLGILLLAAGGSSRMGTQKLLLPWGESTVVGHSLEAALGVGAEQVIVVTGCDADSVAAACRSVSGGRMVDLCFNPDWATGMLSSIRVGLSALDPTLDGFFVALGDMPLITPEVYRRLAAAFREAPDRYVLPTFDGKRGHPVLFPIAVAGMVDGPPADTGLRALLQRSPERVLAVPVTTSAVCLDLDTPEQYAEAMKERARLADR